MSDQEDIQQIDRINDGKDIIELAKSLDVPLELLKGKSMAEQAKVLEALAKKSGPLGKATKGLGVAIDVYNTANGVHQIADGADENDALKATRGIHDVTDGVLGLGGNLPGPIGQGFKAAGAGFAIGDLLAPLVFGSYADANKPHSEEIPAGGFQPSSGCAPLDPIIAPMAHGMEWLVGDVPPLETAQAPPSYASDAEAMAYRILEEARRTHADQQSHSEQEILPPPGMCQ
jgi:hypothetical protein